MKKNDEYEWNMKMCQYYDLFCLIESGLFSNVSDQKLAYMCEPEFRNYVVDVRNYYSTSYVNKIINRIRVELKNRRINRFDL